MKELKKKIAELEMELFELVREFEFKHQVSIDAIYVTKIKTSTGDSFVSDLSLDVSIKKS